MTEGGKMRLNGHELELRDDLRREIDWHAQVANREAEWLKREADLRERYERAALELTAKVASEHRLAGIEFEKAVGKQLQNMVGRPEIANQFEALTKRLELIVHTLGATDEGLRATIITQGEEFRKMVAQSREERIAQMHPLESLMSKAAGGWQTILMLGMLAAVLFKLFERS